MSIPGKMIHDFISDAPISDPSLDLFRRWSFSQRLAEIVKSRSDPSSIVVGIYGGWGEGKTTVLNFIEHELRKHESTICIRFNPWNFSNEIVLVMNFFQTIAEALDKNLSSTKERIGELIKTYAFLVAPLTVSLPIGGVSLSGFAKELGQQLSSVSIEDRKEKIQEILRQESKRIVVLIDDIDRLDKSEIYAVFKLVKLTADFNYITYVMAFDEKMVSSALEDKYASATGQAGRNFLEKIIQVPLHLPAVDRNSLRRLFFKGVEQALNDIQVSLEENQAQEFMRYFIDGLEIRLKNPRACRRFANALIFSLPILREEVNVVDLMAIEGFRIFYPELYEAIRQNPGIFTGILIDRQGSDIKFTTQKIIENSLKTYADEEKKCARELLQEIFPKLKSFSGKVHYDRSWETRWANERRIAAREYFSRYFIYSVPADDISDQEIDLFISSVTDKTINEVKELLQSLVNDKNADRVFYKLRQRKDNLSISSSAVLAQAIAQSDSIFFATERTFLFTTTWLEAAILISHLLRNVPKGKERLELAEQIIRLAQTLTFKIACFRWMRSSPERTPEDNEFSQQDESYLGQIVANAIRLEAQTETIYKKYGKDTRFLLGIWSRYTNSREPSEYLEQTFDKDKINVLEFLKTYLSVERESEYKLLYNEDLEASNYNAIVAIVDPDIIYSRLKRIFGDDLELAKDKFYNDIDPLDKKIAYQFSHYYLKKK